MLGLVTIVSFGLGSQSGLDATFVLSGSNALTDVPDLHLSRPGVNLVLGLVIVVLGALLVAGVVRYRIYLRCSSAPVFRLFTVALLVWAARATR